MSGAALELIYGDRPDEVVGVPADLVAVVDDGTTALDVRLEIAVQNKVAVIRHAEFSQRPNGPAVSAATVRSIPLAKLLADALNLGCERYRFDPRAAGTQTVEPIELSLSEAERRRLTIPPTRGRPGPTDEQILEAVKIYKKGRVASGDALDSVAKELKIARSTVAAWMRRARDRGMLQ
jgi:hypothetical protein